MGEIADLEAAVDEFAAEMKARLRGKARCGWGGWESMGRDDLGGRLLSNAAKGAVLDTRTNRAKKSLVDTANLAMMIWRNGV